MLAADRGRGGATSMRCGGCQAAAQFAHDEARYGRLVRHFLARHEHCGNAVEITPGPSPLPQPGQELRPELAAK
jgi:hypothetical protein